MAQESNEREVAYLALDPGETTGWAKFDSNGELLGYGQYTQNIQTQWLTENLDSSLKAVICEEYRIYNKARQRQWDRNRTSKNEGAIEMLCEMRKVPFFLQPASVKKIGYKWAGLGEAPSNHAISHQFDAVAHGTYWLRQRKILKPIIPKD